MRSAARIALALAPPCRFAASHPKETGRAQGRLLHRQVSSEEFSDTLGNSSDRTHDSRTAKTVNRMMMSLALVQAARRPGFFLGQLCKSFIVIGARSAV